MQASRPRAGGRGHAVVIEDVAADRTLLEGLLRAHGYAPSVHDRPEVEPAQLAGEEPRLILLSADVKNGFNLCLRFKKDPVLRRVPLVLVTAKASPEVIRKHRMLPTRADAYLTKPLTEAAVLQALAQVLPDDFGPNAREIEINVAETPDRTLVSNGTLESAVVSYVEEEVRTLKDAVERLISEKSSLGGKVVDLESQVRSQREILDSGLERLGPRKEADTAPVSVVAVEPEDMEDRLEAARKEGYDAGIEAGRADRRTRGLEQGRREGRAEAATEFQAERDELEETIASLERRSKELEGRVAELAGRESDYRAELAQTTQLFERLEGGYKDALSKAEAEKANVEEALARTEAERDEVADRLASIESTATDAADTLAARDARIAALESETETLRRRIEASIAAGARVQALEAELEAQRQEIGELTVELEAAREALADLEPLRQAEAAARTETERLKDRLQRVRDALQAGEEPS